MTDFKDIKVGDHVRIATTRVELVEVDTRCVSGCFYDEHGTFWDPFGPEPGDGLTRTFEVIERPREVGWWEVEVRASTFSGVLNGTFRWDGTDWLAPDGRPIGWKYDDLTPLHYIGKGSQG